MGRGGTRLRGGVAEQPKWVVSRSLKSVGPNATLVEDDIEAVIRGLKDQLVGEIEVAGPDLAGSLTDLGLIDEIDSTSIPSCLVRQAIFSGPRPPLRLVTSDLFGEDVIRLTYFPLNRTVGVSDRQQPAVAPRSPKSPSVDGARFTLFAMMACLGSVDEASTDDPAYVRLHHDMQLGCRATSRALRLAAPS